MTLHGHLCAVTGASSGIGEAVARGLAQAGARVVGLARRFSPAKLERIPEPGELINIQLDVTDELAVAQCISTMDTLADDAGGLRVLVNSAGSGVFSAFSELDVADLDTMLAVHIKGSYLCSRAAVNAMRPRGSGYVAFVSSVAATRAFATCAGYAAAKAGQLALARGLAEEVRTSGIRVTAFLSGAVDTPIWDQRPDFDRERMMRVDDVANLIVSVLEHPGVVVEELSMVPAGGHL